MVLIIFIGEGDDEPGIRDSLHREKPLRVERSRGPRMLPA